MKQILLFFSMAFLCAVGARAQSNEDSLAQIRVLQLQDSMFRATLTRAGATSAQIQEFKSVVELTKSKINIVTADATLTAIQKKQKIKTILTEKDARYKEVLGEQKYQILLRITNAPPGVDPFL